MDGRQVTWMIAAEAITYALAGCVIGCTGGLFIGKVLFHILIQDHFPERNTHLPPYHGNFLAVITNRQSRII